MQPCGIGLPRSISRRGWIRTPCINAGDRPEITPLRGSGGVGRRRCEYNTYHIFEGEGWAGLWLDMIFIAWCFGFGFGLVLWTFVAFSARR